MQDFLKNCDLQSLSQQDIDLLNEDILEEEIENGNYGLKKW